MAKVSYIAVAGNIGCGKSTLVDFLCRTYDLKPFYEPNAENPYLVDFYSDMKTWGFHSQMFFLSHKFRLHRKLEHQRKREVVVQDRTIYEDAEIFASYLRRRGFIAKREWALYRTLYETIIDTLAPPDLMIYLSAGVGTIRKRIRSRARPEEQDIPVSYLRTLNRLYENWFESYDLSPTLVVPTDQIDYLSDLEHRLDFRRAIEARLK